MPSYEKHDRRDRYDRIYVKDQDSLHIITPYLFPKRCDNEAVLGEVIELDVIKAYLEKKNAENPDFKYTWFHVIAAAIAKTLVLRPKMNRFYSGRRLFQKRFVDLSFVVRKSLEADTGEALATVKIDPEGGSVVNQIHDFIRDFATKVRKNASETVDGATDKMNLFQKLPRWILNIVFAVLRRLEYHGRYPKALRKDDPCYSSVFISNLGSIKMKADYHHLYEWGTCSFFAVISEKKMRPKFNEDGTYEMHDTVKLGLTVDERIADGYYFAKSLRLLKHLLSNPELLDLAVATPVENY